MQTENITLSTEATNIAREHAAAAGQSLGQWLTEAINAHAAGQTPRIEIPIDDCGFYSPLIIADRNAA